MRGLLHTTLAATLLLALGPAGAALAADPSSGGTAAPGRTGLDVPASVVSLRAVWNVDAAQPGGDEAVLGIVTTVAEGFHINADIAQERIAGDFDPYETTVRVIEADPALTIESVRFPEAHALTAEYAVGEIYGFDGETVFYLPMRVVEGTEPGALLPLRVEVVYQACDDVNCLFPMAETLSVALPVVAAGRSPSPLNEALFAGLPSASAGGPGSGVAFDVFGANFSVDVSSGWGIGLLLLVAVFGGMLLNFTPCVLPVIPIKIIGLSKAAGSRGRMLALGATMALGVIAFWMALGGLIAGVSGFTATNQLFQFPAFTIGVGVVIMVMAVAMAGLFFIRLPNFVYAFNPGQESLHGSFGFGIMTAILSTPCTAPFMGAAAAWAATRHPATTLATFFAIGLGMALPYLVLSVSPGLVRKMPKTGPASELIKQVMGLFMLAAGAYFIGVGVSALLVTAPDPPSKLYWWVVMAFVAAAGAWLAIQTLRLSRRTAARVVFTAIGLGFVAAAGVGGARLTHPGPIDWVYYTPERFESALGSGKVVVMDFTAEWCLNCKSLEHSVLHNDRVSGLLAEDGVVPIKVDITGNNPPGKAMLQEAGRLTIPLLVIYAADGREVFKSDFYTVDQVVDAVAEARMIAARR